MDILTCVQKAYAPGLIHKNQQHINNIVDWLLRYPLLYGEDPNSYFKKEIG